MLSPSILNHGTTISTAIYTIRMPCTVRAGSTSAYLQVMRFASLYRNWTLL